MSGAIDLHTHTTLSDGTCEPDQLVAIAAAAGVTALAITDHEHVEACDRAAAAARWAGVTLIPGVELDAACDRGILHILGYGVDPACGVLRGRLAALRAARVARNEALCAALARTVGWIDLAEVGAAERLPLHQISVRHIVKALVREGHCDDREAAADDVARCAVRPLAKPDAATCIAWIRDAGGAAVWAHPSTVCAAGAADRAAMIRTLARHGLEGVEVIHPSHPPALEEELLGLAADAGLLATGGSDYHGARRPGRTLGIRHRRVARAVESLAGGRA